MIETCCLKNVVIFIQTIMEEYWIFQVFKYVRFLHMQALHKVLNMPEYSWVMPHGRSTVLNMPSQHLTVLNKLPVLNMSGLRLCQVCEHVRVTPCWICLNKLEYALIMSQYDEYSLITLKKNSTEYTRILQVSDAVHSIRSLYKLRSSYRGRCIQNTAKHLR